MTFVWIFNSSKEEEEKKELLKSSRSWDELSHNETKRNETKLNRIDVTKCNVLNPLGKKPNDLNASNSELECISNGRT